MQTSSNLVQSASKEQQAKVKIWDTCLSICADEPEKISSEMQVQHNVGNLMRHVFELDGCTVWR